MQDYSSDPLQVLSEDVVHYIVYNIKKGLW